jgi:hypothetical protein
MFLINAQGGSGIPSFGAFGFWESELGRWPPDGKPAGSAAYKFRMRAVLTPGFQHLVKIPIHLWIICGLQF